MGILGGTLGYYILKLLNKEGRSCQLDGSMYTNNSKLETLLGADIWQVIQDKLVIDFGCGTGTEAVDLAQHGAKRVIGIDIQEGLLTKARNHAALHKVDNCCIFAKQTYERADVIVAIDSFEHFDDPDMILKTMRKILKPDGYVFVAFGPPWYHPLGGHLFSIFPWSHLIFTEKTLIRWRSEFKFDGATRFQEVEGGLNQMTIRRFEKIVEESPFKFARFEAVPIRKLRRIANRVTREFTTAIVRCTLVPRS
jgi:SAM-dependent methyltransferase